jgi:tetratricopeptide (TPR) repeat protein
MLQASERNAGGRATMASIPSTFTVGLALLMASMTMAAAPSGAGPANAAPALFQEAENSHMRTVGVPTSPAAPNVSYMYQLSPETQGDLYMARRQYVAAIGAYQHGELRKSLTWTKIGVAYHHLFAMDEAMKAYQLALRLDTHNADALNNIGAVYHGKHEFGNAAKYYKKALKYRPHSAAIYCNLGTTYFADHKYKDAEKAYNHAFALDPEAFNHNSNASIDEGSTREERIAQNYYLARAFARAGQHEQALIYLRKAFDEGFHDRRRLNDEQDFAMLRTTMEFKQLMAAQRLN